MQGTLDQKYLKKGSKGSSVVELQKKLNQFVEANLKLDGDFGQLTFNALVKFQAINKLPVSGVVDYFTSRALYPTKSFTKIDLLLHEASRWIGVCEVGNNGGEIVGLFQKSVGLNAGDSWCLAFCQFCLQQTDLIYRALTGDYSQHTLIKSGHCLTTYNAAKYKTDKPEVGSLVIWQHGNTINGHVGIVVAVFEDNTFMTIEGNTSTSTSVERNGGGVYLKTRSIGRTGDMSIKGFIKPWG